MTGRVYTIEFDNVSVAAVQDALAVYAGSGMAFKVHEVTLGQITATSIGNLRLTLKRLPATVTAGSGGSTPTPRKLNNGDAAATVTAHANDTTQATTSGTSQTLRGDIFNVINGFLYQPAPDDRPVIAPGQAFIVSLDSAPASAQTMSGTVTIEELF